MSEADNNRREEWSSKVEIRIGEFPWQCKNTANTMEYTIGRVAFLLGAQLEKHQLLVLPSCFHQRDMHAFLQRFGTTDQYQCLSVHNAVLVN